MRKNLETLFGKYKQKGIFVDTNMLVLYIVGSINPNYLKQYSPGNRSYDENDYNLISRFIDSYQMRITTPQILSEVSNLLGERNDYGEVLKAYIKISDEIFVESEILSDSHGFMKFGLADSSVIEVSRNAFLVFTDDSKLFGYLNNEGIAVVNFDWLKTEAS